MHTDPHFADPHFVHATIAHAAGIAREKAVVTATGRPFHVGGTKAKPILEMFA